MEEVGCLLAKTFQKYSLQGQKPILEILLPLWPRVMGRLISQNSRPVAFSGGALTMEVSSPTWTTQLRAMSDALRAQINQFLGAPLVERLYIRQGARSGPWQHVGSRPAAVVPKAIESGKLDGLEIDSEKLLWAKSRVKLAPELAEVVERSFIKYFSRSREKPNS